MTVPVQIPVTSSVANGVTTVFPFTFKITNEADLTVTVDDVVVTTGFTVTGIGNDDGGDVTFDTAPANGLKVIRFLNPVLSRVVDYQQFGDWLADIVNGDFDRIWLTLQYLSQLGVRTIQLPVDTTTTQIINEDAVDRADKVIGFDGDGNVILKTSAEINPEIGEAVADAQASAIAAAASEASAETEANSAASSADAAAASAASIDINASAIQHQTKTAFTTTGSAATFAVTTSPLYGAYAANERMRIKFNAGVASGASTLNRDTLGAKGIKQYDTAGAKVDAIISANKPYDIEYDGTDYVIINPSTLVYATTLQLPGGQIKFPATQNASSNANTLDDYEEGDWTATLSFSTQPIGTYSATYIKIGRLVTICFSTTMPTQTDADQVLISGVPFFPDAPSTVACSILTPETTAIRAGLLANNIFIQTSAGAAVSYTTMSGKSLTVFCSYLTNS